MAPYARAAWAAASERLTMKLLVFYIVFVGIGEAIAYAVGRTVELWSPATSLPVFLAAFFFVLWGAWRLAVNVA
jgi:integral membrane sensor domain MASE1